jgi:hypothetical protein
MHIMSEKADTERGGLKSKEQGLISKKSSERSSKHEKGVTSGEGCEPNYSQHIVFSNC